MQAGKELKLIVSFELSRHEITDYTKITHVNDYLAWCGIRITDRIRDDGTLYLDLIINESRLREIYNCAN